MAQVKLGLNRLSRAEKLTLAQGIIDAMTGNANFPTPEPDLTEVATARTTLETRINEMETARNEAKQATVNTEVAESALDAVLTSLASHVQNVSDGDEPVILSAGMDVRSEGGPISMIPVTGLEASPGDDSGEVDLVWDPVSGAKSYEVQTSPDPITSGSWQHGDIAPKSKLSLTGLPTGDRCWFRVRAVGANDKGAWSDPATKVVP